MQMDRTPNEQALGLDRAVTADTIFLMAGARIPRLWISDLLVTFRLSKEHRNNDHTASVWKSRDCFLFL
jgi:hypothetical protein